MSWVTRCDTLKTRLKNLPVWHVVILKQTFSKNCPSPLLGIFDTSKNQKPAQSALFAYHTWACNHPEPPYHQIAWFPFPSVAWQQLVAYEVINQSNCTAIFAAVEKRHSRAFAVTVPSRVVLRTSGRRATARATSLPAQQPQGMYILLPLSLCKCKIFTYTYYIYIFSYIIIYSFYKHCVCVFFACVWLCDCLCVEVKKQPTFLLFNSSKWICSVGVDHGDAWGDSGLKIYIYIIYICLETKRQCLCNQPYLLHWKDFSESRWVDKHGNTAIFFFSDFCRSHLLGACATHCSAKAWEVLVQSSKFKPLSISSLQCDDVFLCRNSIPRTKMVWSGYKSSSTRK